MDIQLKQRLIGAIMLSGIMVALAVMLLNDTPPPLANNALSGGSSIAPIDDAKPPSRKPVDNTAWVVQLGSFSNAINALRLRDKLRAKGFRAFVEAVQINDKQNTRVYVGPEIGQVKAKAVRKSLEKDFKLKGLVVKYSE